MIDKEREEILDRMGRRVYAQNEFLRSIFDTVEDYLDKKPSKDFPCRDCGKIIKYYALYTVSASYKDDGNGNCIIDKPDGCVCKECSWKRRLANY